MKTSFRFANLLITIGLAFLIIFVTLFLAFVIANFRTL